MHQPAVVLVVEDDLSTQRLLVAVVQHLGLEARTAGDGHEALAAIAERAPEVVLLDLIMPGMDGFGVLREMKLSWPALLARTIVITAASIRDVHEHPDLGLVWKFLRKPLDIEQLGDCVRDCVDQRSKKAGRDSAYETPPRP
jgi:DNA-binding NtrC family response regulator